MNTLKKEVYGNANEFEKSSDKMLLNLVITYTRRYILIGKHSELYKYVAMGMQTCCRRIEVIGAVLSSDII